MIVEYTRYKIDESRHDSFEKAYLAERKRSYENRNYRDGECRWNSGDRLATQGT